MKGMSKVSKERLATCHENLQRVVNRVAKYYRVQVIEGNRSKERQKELVKNKKSKTMDSKHLPLPSLAVDIAPLRVKGDINWKDAKAFCVFAGYVLLIAEEENVKIRWGGNWDMDEDMDDQTFDDLVHFELV